MKELVVNKQSIEAVARLIVTLIASVATVLGWSLNEELWLNLVITAVTLYCLIRELWWKNQNVTNASQTAQEVTDAIKNGEGVEIKFLDQEAEEAVE